MNCSLLNAIEMAEGAQEHLAIGDSRGGVALFAKFVGLEKREFFRVGREHEGGALLAGNIEAAGGEDDRGPEVVASDFVTPSLFASSEVDAMEVGLTGHIDAVTDDDAGADALGVFLGHAPEAVCGRDVS